ncbi:MAG: PAS domain-containing protein [Elusimicrobiales bacterium]
MEIYRNILESLSSGIIAFSKDGRIIYLNPMAKKILHLPHPIENTDYRKSLSSIPQLVGVIDEMIISNRTVQRAEIKIVQSNFNLTLGYSSMQLKDSNMNHIGYIMIFRDLRIIYENK